MTEIDPATLRSLQGELGRLRQEALNTRREHGLEALTGTNAREHGRSLIQRVVTDHEARRAETGQEALSWEDRQDLVGALESRLFGAGTLQHLLDDPTVENIDINGFHTVFVEYSDGQTAEVGPVAASNEELIETIQTLAAYEGLSSRAFDVANVRVNLRLPDGSRLYALQSVTHEPVVSIRKHRHRRVRLKELVQNGTMSQDLADFLAAAVRARKNIIIAGATGSGKTTLLRALAAEIDPSERIVTVERSLELGLNDDREAHPNAIAIEERLPNNEGAGAEPMAHLVRDSLRLNPARVMVGEVLGDEVVTMLNAMTQGNEGSLSTIHANSSADVVNKIATYAIQAPERLPWEATVQLVASALDFVVFLRRGRTEDEQWRVVESVREIVGVIEGSRLATNELWARAERRRTPGSRGAPVVNRTVVQCACEDDLLDAGWQPDGWSDTAGGWQ